MWPFKRKKLTEPVAKKPHPLSIRQLFAPKDEQDGPEIIEPVASNTASNSVMRRRYLELGQNQGMGQDVAAWYASQSFIGYDACAWIGKHWLVDKAVSTPARDAIRQGYEVSSDNDKVVALLAEQDELLGINGAMSGLITTGRRMGGAVALFHTCPTGTDEDEYYSAPLNNEAVTEYRGVVIVGADDVTPMPVNTDVNDPASQDYLCPSMYRIGTRSYHKSHLRVFIPYPVANRLKPTYRYFGQSLPERIYERVYASERSANEAPLLAMTKRLKTLGVDLESILLSDDAMGILQDNIRGLQEFADNSGVFVYDTGNGGGLSQIDTALGDLDSLIMTQYQLCAAISEVPASKLLEQSIGGLGSTGEYEQDSYFERLESIQTNDLLPLLDMHHELVKQVNGITDVTTVAWAALDSPDAKEFAEIDSLNSASVAVVATAGVIGQDEARAILDSTKDSIYFGKLKAWEDEHGDTDDLIDEALDDESKPEA